MTRLKKFHPGTTIPPALEKGLKGTRVVLSWAGEVFVDEPRPCVLELVAVDLDAVAVVVGVVSPFPVTIECQ
jgi:hypothetical protein